jgi:hypothetical protein
MATREVIVPIRNYIYVSAEFVRFQSHYEGSLSDKLTNNPDFIYDGKVTKYKVITDEKKKTINVTYFFEFITNSYKVDMLTSANGNTIVTLSPRDTTIIMTYHGKIE